jgi:hypothetical protein
MRVARANRYPQPRPAAEVLAETHAELCEHDGLPGRCPACRASLHEPPEAAAPRPKRRRRRKPKPPPAPPVQIQFPLSGPDDDGPACRGDR